MRRFTVLVRVANGRFQLCRTAASGSEATPKRESRGTAWAAAAVTGALGGASFIAYQAGLLEELPWLTQFVRQLQTSADVNRQTEYSGNAPLEKTEEGDSTVSQVSTSTETSSASACALKDTARPLPSFDDIDTNHDGVISADEYKAFLERQAQQEAPSAAAAEDGDVTRRDGDTNIEPENDTLDNELASTLAHTESLLASLCEALDAVNANRDSDEKEALLREAVAAAENATGFIDENDTFLVEARARLADMDARRKMLATRDAACVELREALQHGNIDACKDALYVLEQTEHDAECERLISSARETIEEFDRAQLIASNRLAAQERLDAAILSRDAAQCREALADAKHAQLEMGPAMKLAAVLSDPERLYADLLRSGEDAVSEMRRIRGLVLDDFSVAAATVADAANDVEHLRQHVDEITRVIVRNYETQARNLENEARTAENQFAVHNLGRTLDKAEQLTHTKDLAKQDRARAIETAAADRLRTDLAGLSEEAQQHSKQLQAQMHQHITQEVEKFITHDRTVFESRCSTLTPPLEAVDNLLNSGKTLHQRSRASTALYTAVSAFEQRLLQGRSAHQELAALREAGAGLGDDDFVVRLIESLPSDAVERSRKIVQNECQLQRSFSDQLSGFVAGAFLPPVTGLFSGMVAQVTGWIFARLYVLKATDFAKTSGSGALLENLAGLANAEALVDRGEIGGAIGALEKLTGECRIRVQGWVTDARVSLLMQQTARAAQAKVRCQNAVLLQ